MPSVRTPADLADLRTETLAAQKATPVWITVCTGTGCCAYGAEALADGFESEIAKRGLRRQVGLRRTGCHGFCERGPLVVIQPKGICYLKAQVKDIPAIVEKTVLGDDVVTKLLYLDDETGKRVRTAAEIPFYKYQKRILLENNVLIDATSILDYIGVGGYTGLAKALNEMTPEAVVQEVKKANLRGRGGAGFSAGYKWETTRNAPGAPKYVIVNGDEGDPARTWTEVCSKATRIACSKASSSGRTPSARRRALFTCARSTRWRASTRRWPSTGPGNTDSWGRIFSVRDSIST